MSIQDDNTLATKGDLKNLYTNKIAPYLGGGISYYYTDRSGQELKTCYARIANKWNAVVNTNVPFIIQSGNIIQPSSGLFTIPNGMRVELVFSSSAYPGGDTSYVYYNNTDSEELPLGNIDPYVTSSYINSTVLSGQWTNDTGHDVNISVRCNGTNGGTTLLTMASFTIKEIGRVVDPVKYVSNNSDLQETPVGNIISYMGNTVPKHYLACDGTIYNIGSYPELEEFITNEFGSINYFGGDGATTWAVPDLQGEFLRGSGTNSHANQGSGGDVGEHQDGTIQNSVSCNGSNAYLIGDYISNVTPDKINADWASGSGTVYYGSANKVAQNTSFGFTSRPTNTSVKYCIKYESTFHAFFSNAAYKVEASFGLNYNSTLQSYVSYAMSYIIGDSSLMNENYFIAPVDGWYMVSFKSNQISYAKPAVQYLQINDVSADAFTDATGSGTSHSNFGVNMTHTIYLSKGDKVNYRVWTNGNTISLPSVRRASFCLLTSNYNPTIVSADSVYSENEQMIGYWEDGKPLYQRTLVYNNRVLGADINTDLNKNTINIIDYDFVHYANSTPTGDVVNKGGCHPQGASTWASWLYFVKSSDSNYWKVASRVGSSLGVSTCSFTITVRYTKTTDAASSLEIENSLLLNRPDLWTPGTEYHFGGGLYGKRISGTMNTTTGVPSYTTIYANFNGNVVSYGGSIRRSVGGNWDFAIPCSYKNNTTVMTGGIATQLSGNVRTLVFYFTDSADMSNVPYDVWVTYKK